MTKLAVMVRDVEHKRDIYLYPSEVTGWTELDDGLYEIERVYFGPCEECDGTGRCVTCNGDGTIDDDHICRDCALTGRCEYCDGTGKTEVYGHIVITGTDLQAIQERDTDIRLLRQRYGTAVVRSVRDWWADERYLEGGE